MQVSPPLTPFWMIQAIFTLSNYLHTKTSPSIFLPGVCILEHFLKMQA